MLSRHLSSVPYQFSIFEDVGGWQLCNHTILEIITWFKTMRTMTKWIDKTKRPHYRPGAVFPWFLFCSQHAQRCSSFIFNFSVCFKLYTQPTTSFNACYTGHMGPQGCCNNFHFHYRCDVSRKIQFMLLLTINENGHFSLYRFSNNGDEDVVVNYKYSENTVKALFK